MFAHILRRMSRPLSTVQRTRQVAQHMMQSTSAAAEPSVLFESVGPTRRYILNRPKKKNALDDSMIALLRPQVEQWDNSELCRLVIGSGAGGSLCAGGDVKNVIELAADESTRPKAINYFKNEFELDYLLASLHKPYVAICDGFTMGGGVGLSAHAPFRIATEKTFFAMPETKIGYAPDVGANYFLPKLDGELGTYLALTGDELVGRAVFEHGLATHFVPTVNLPKVVERLASLDDPTYEKINEAIEEHYLEPQPEEVTKSIIGEKRVALDTAFGHNSVEEIIANLEEYAQSTSQVVSEWAKSSLSALGMRSPTSLRVALEAIRRGKTMSLEDVFQMELGIATAFLTGASTDFTTGVTAVLIERIRNVKPQWKPSDLKEVDPQTIIANFFSPESPYVRQAPKLEFSGKGDEASIERVGPMHYALPTEIDIEKMVRGTHPHSGGVAYNLDQLVEKFRRMTEGKFGVDTKIREVAARRCEIAEDPDNHHCLRWKN